MPRSWLSTATQAQLRKAIVADSVERKKMLDRLIQMIRQEERVKRG